MEKMTPTQYKNINQAIYQKILNIIIEYITLKK